MPTLGHLPPEILRNVAAHLSKDDYVALNQTCKYLFRHFNSFLYEEYALPALEFFAVNGFTNKQQSIERQDLFRVHIESADSLLEKAASHGQVDIISLLLQKVNPTTAILTAMLIRAAGRGHDNIVMLLIDKLGHPNAVDGNYTALMVAAAEGQEHTVQCLLTMESIDIHYQNADQQTALRLATMHGHVEIAMRLVATFGPEEALNHGIDTLLAAAFYGHTSIVLQLIAILPDNRRETQDAVDEALLLAAKGGHLDTVNAILKIGGGILRSDNDTAIFLAAQRGHTEVVLQIASQQDMGWHRDNNGSTPLMRAITYGQNSTAEALVIMMKKSDLQAENDSGDTAMTLAARTGTSELFTLLVNRLGVAQDLKGRTPLLVATMSGRKDLVEYLIKLRPSRQLSNKALNMATHHDHLPIMELLLPICGRNAALFWATKNGAEGLVKRLIDDGIDLNVHIRTTTPLIIAVQRGHVKLVKLLLDSGRANAGLPDESGKTPWTHAIELHKTSLKGYAEILKLLRRRRSLRIRRTASQKWPSGN